MIKTLFCLVALVKVGFKQRHELALEKDAPEPRAIQAANLGPVIELSEVGGLHHRYERRAA